MLLALSLRDFVIVQQLHLNFQTGFTVLTGETGAGKSITLDALGLLMGDKADFSQVRHGAKEAQLSALFDLNTLPELQQQLHEQGLLEKGETELSLRRIIDAKGKSRNFINNQTATLTQLKAIGSQLIDIHGQNAHHSLNQESAQRQLLDAFAHASELAQTVKYAYQTWQNAEHQLKEAQNHAENLAIERERLEWQFNELEQLNLHENEWETLNQAYDSLAHAAELLQSAGQVQEWVSHDDGLQQQVFRCQKTLIKLSEIEPRFAECLNMFASIEAELGEINHYLAEVLNDVEINPNELANKEARLHELMNIARKYRVEPEDLPKKYQEIQDKLNDLDAATDIEALQQTVIQAQTSYHQYAKKLSQIRQQAAQKLAQETTAHMQQLAMKGAQFHIELIACAPTAHGLEHVQYQVSANKGNPLRPLNKVASGGELARISLSIQVVTSQYTSLPTLIFDEVDTGIGGSVAQTVGRALRDLGKYHQVLAITHLPQVAACGEQHWQVEKHQEGEQIVSHIHILNHAKRIEEIARMLGGEVITDTTRQHATEMLNLAEK